MHRAKPTKNIIIAASAVVIMVILVVASVIIFRPSSNKVEDVPYDIFRNQIRQDYSCENNPLPVQKCYCKCADTCNSKDQYNDCVKQNLCDQIL